MEEIKIGDRILNLLAGMFNQENYLHIMPDRGVSVKQSASLPSLYSWNDWNEDAIKRELGIVNLPEDLRTFWFYCSSLIMHFERDEGLAIQGIYIYSMEQALLRHNYFVKQKELAKTTEDIHKGDLLIGEYFSERQYILIRCDESCDDFGSILMTQPIDPREEWPIAAPSLIDFLETYFSANEKFWEREEYWRT
ncbi:MAG: hypothetical protein HC921_21670 [Synechococcaceae cyanobacterium SM2_3_1]|nr:hypothetical protein [Synechococcaceae cyanobacterium SM2_3_1]